MSWNVCWFLFVALHWHGLHFVGLRTHCGAVPLARLLTTHHMIPPLQFSKHDMEGVRGFFSLHVTHVTQDECCGPDRRLHGYDERLEGSHGSLAFIKTFGVGRIRRIWRTRNRLRHHHPATCIGAIYSMDTITLCLRRRCIFIEQGMEFLFGFRILGWFGCTTHLTHTHTRPRANAHSCRFDSNL